MSRPIFMQLGVAALVGASLLAGCDRRDERAPAGSDSTTTASTEGRDAANTTGDTGGTVSGATGATGTGMGGGNPNGQGTGDSSTRSNVPAGALPAPAASAGRDNEGLNRGDTNSR